MSYELRFERAGGRLRGGVHVRRANMPDKRIKIEDKLLQTALTHSGWDRIEVRCVAGVATVIVNGVVLLNIERLDALGGKVGFAGEGVSYRHARLTSLPMDTHPAFLTAHQPGEEGLEMPTVITSVAPEMPAKVVGMVSSGSILGYQHVVWIEVVIDERGQVVAARYLRRLDDKDVGFNENAMRAVRGWTFNPARLDGAPVPICVTMELHYTVQ
jgi:TonB family protein